MTKKINESPWGQTHSADEIAPGIFHVTTASHGGYYVAPERMAEMPAVLVKFQPFAGGNWYEEDCDWAVVALAFPQHFEGMAVYYALDMFTVAYTGLAKQVRLADYLATPQGQEAKAKANEWFERNKNLFLFGSQSGGGSQCNGQIISVDRTQQYVYASREWPSLTAPFTLDQARAAGLTVAPYPPPKAVPVPFDEGDCSGVFNGHGVVSDADPGL